jgi:hypothetical protein
MYVNLFVRIHLLVFVFSVSVSFLLCSTAESTREGSFSGAKQKRGQAKDAAEVQLINY